MLKSRHSAEIKSEKLLEYVQMEIGRTIHLPFQEPLVDVYDHTPDDGHAVLFAAPSEEVGKLIHHNNSTECRCIHDILCEDVCY